MTDAFVQTISQMALVDPLAVNMDCDTAFDVAAEFPDNRRLLPGMLEAFLPTICCDQAVSRSFGTRDFQLDAFKSLLNRSARRGQPEVIATFIRHGVDPTEVLSTVVPETVRRRDRIADHLAVYRELINSVTLSVLWWSLFDRRTVDARPRFDRTIQQLKMSLLIEGTDDSSYPNAIELAIDCGAKEMLLAILKTENVYRFKRKQHNRDRGYVQQYDVTYLTDETFPPKKTEHSSRDSRKTSTEMRLFDADVETTEYLRDKLRKPKESYVKRIVGREKLWRDTDVFRCEPFATMVEPYVWFTRRMFALLGFAHCTFMTFLSFECLTTRTIAADDSALNDTTSTSSYVHTTCPEAPGPAWLIWPVLLFVYQMLSFVEKLASLVKKCEFSGRPVMFAFHKLPFLTFTIAFFVWYNDMTTTSQQDVGTTSCASPELTSVVLLFGWIVGFILFSGIFKELYVFSIVLLWIIAQVRYYSISLYT